MKRWFLHALALLALVPQGLAQFSLSQVYSAVRPALCLLMGQANQCSLPQDILTPVDYARVKRAIAQAPDMYVLGEGSAIPRAFFDDLGLRMTRPDPGAPRDFQLLWATTSRDQEALDRWVKNLLRANPQAGQNSIVIVALPTSGTTAAVARVPFIGIGNSVYFSLGNAWIELNGSVTTQVLGVIRSSARYFIAAKTREEEANRR